MKAQETHLGKILGGTTQYVVPLFQRPYTWDESRWKVLWSDLVELCEDDVEDASSKPHFLGSLVTVPTRSVPEGVGKFLLIDGQQRLTTLQVLLAALRDASKDMPGTLSDKINQLYLINQFETGLDNLKLLPTQTNDDRANFIEIVSANGAGPSLSISRIRKAYDWFRKKLLSKGCPDFDKLADVILKRLSLVSIVLDHDDNPHLIFESLNYKGEPLTQSDLIRNYFLMRIPVSQQEPLFKKCWEPMQGMLAERMSDFVRHYLMREGSVVKQGEIYRTLKDRTDSQTPDQISSFLEAMHRSAVHYHRLLAPSQEPDNDLRNRLLRFQRLDVGVAWPFLLNLYSDFDGTKLSKPDFLNTLDVLENFFVRRFVCSVPTHGLNKSLPPLYNQASSYPSLLEGVKAILSQRDYPSDAAFRNALLNVRLYGTGERLPKVRLVLESLERALAGKEPVAPETLTLEHVMPQTLSDWWRTHLGESWQETHETILHSLGNLTLTGYNAELSNGDFPSKLKIFANSPIYLTRDIAKLQRWDADAIQQRGEVLADLAIKVWPYFGTLKDQPSEKVNYTGKSPISLSVFGAVSPVTSWRDVLGKTLMAIRDSQPDTFDEVVEKFPKLFVSDPNTVNAARTLIEGKLFYESNLSAMSIVRYCQQVVEASGHSAREWKVETNI